jgi:hypothetical protein
MKTKYIGFKGAMLGFLILTLSLVSCQKKNDDIATASRLFRPMPKSVDVVGNSIVVTVYPMTGAVAYTVQLSTDTFRTILKTITVSKDTTTATFYNLMWAHNYFVRAMSINSDTTLNSRWIYYGGSSTSLAITTGQYPSILTTLNDSDKIDVALRLRWINSGIPVDAIKVLNLKDSSLVETLTVTTADNTAQMKTVTGLVSAHSYIIYALSGDSLRGWSNYTTKSLVVSGNIIDFRPITHRTTILSDTLTQTVNPIPDKSCIILQRGQTYDITSVISLGKSITFVSGLAFGALPATINMASNFDFVAGSSPDSIIFRDVTLSSTDATAKYVFNSKNSATVGKISFESCTMQVLRGVTRLQSGTINVNTYNINNCIIDSIAGSSYGVVQVDNATANIQNIIIQNSTIYKTQKVVTSAKSTTNTASVLINNCTFYDDFASGLYLVDFGSPATGLTGLTITNCIFAKTRDAAAAKGIRVATTTNVTSTNNYYTTDYVVSSANGPIPNLIAYNGKSATIFKDPINAIFTIIDSKFAGYGVAGDPRWYK